MSLEKAKIHLEKFNIADKVMEFDKSSATVDLAAVAVGCEPDRIAKTLSFVVNDVPVLIVVSGLAKIDNRKFKDTFKTKAKMIEFDKVEEMVGHAPGGVCPFGVEDNVVTYLDVSLKKYDVVYPAAGSGNSAVKLTIEDFEKVSCMKEWIDVCKK